MFCLIDSVLLVCWLGIEFCVVMNLTLLAGIWFMFDVGMLCFFVVWIGVWMFGVCLFDCVNVLLFSWFCCSIIGDWLDLIVVGFMFVLTLLICVFAVGLFGWFAYVLFGLTFADFWLFDLNYFGCLWYCNLILDFVLIMFVVVTHCLGFLVI